MKEECMGKDVLYNGVETFEQSYIIGIVLISTFFTHFTLVLIPPTSMLLILLSPLLPT